MSLIPIIIASLYDHFYKMKERGRKVVPWVQTVFTCALEATFLTFLVGKNILQISGSNRAGHVNTTALFFLILLAGGLYFFIIKWLFFDNEKFIDYYEAFLALPGKKRRIYKILVIGAFIVIPFLLVYKVWYDAV